MTSEHRQKALRDVVDQAYRVFGRYPAPEEPLDVCFSCCVTPEVEHQLRRWPLRDLTAQHLYEYNDSAKSSVQQASEVGYLLPRMLELLAEGEQIHHSLELALDRLGRCPPGSWNDEERESLDRFARAYFDVVLHIDPPWRGQRWMNDPLDVLLMFDIGGLSIEPLLDRWLRCDDPQATVQFVIATYWSFWGRDDYANAFASDRPAFQTQLKDWLLDPDNRSCFAARLSAPGFQHQIELQGTIGHTPFSTMVASVLGSLRS